MRRLCIVYVRVSTDDQARHGYSLADQEDECRKRAHALGYDAAAIVVLKDEGYSGDLVDRPGLNRLRDLVAQKAVGHVVIMDPDRFARNLALQLVVTEEIVRSGAELVFIQFEWTNTPEGKLFYSLRGAIAEYEKAKIRERTRRGKERKAKLGLVPADPRLYGYRYDPASGKLEPHPEEAAVLLLMKDLLLQGDETGQRLTAQGIARWLAARGVPAPRGQVWHASTVCRQLRNETYTGTYWAFRTEDHRGVKRPRPRERQYAIAVAPLWSAATRQALLARLAANRHQEGGQQARPGHYLLRGLVYCGACGGTVRMGCKAVHDRRGHYTYYACNNKSRARYRVGSGERLACPGRYWPAAGLDQKVWCVIRRALTDPGALPGELHGLVAQPPDSGSLERELGTLEQSLARLQASESRTLTLWTTGRLTDLSVFDGLMAPIRQARARVAGRRAELQRLLRQRRAAAAARRTGDETLLRALRAGIQAADRDFTLRRQIVQHLLHRVVVDEDAVTLYGHLNAGNPDCGYLEAGPTGVAPAIYATCPAGRGQGNPQDGDHRLLQGCGRQGDH